MATSSETETFPSPLENDGLAKQSHDSILPVEHGESSVAAAESHAAMVQALNVQDSVDGASEVKTTSKRTRRVGTVGTRKAPRLDDPPRLHEVNAISVEAAANAGFENHFKVNSKHDEKWQKMLEKLIEYKEAHNGSTLVPQCYDRDPRLGRWVHYQRVEYWLYLSNQQAKINAERIARLNAIGFEWDPQKAQWDSLYERLKQFHAAFNHCKVPKGYTKDKELANWVRNQRLEYAQMQRGKKNRMTQERLGLLNALNFTWSTSMPQRSKSPQKLTSTEDEKEANDDEKVVTDSSKQAYVAPGTSNNGGTLDADVGIKKEQPESDTPITPERLGRRSYPL